MPLHWNVDHRLNIFVLGSMDKSAKVDSNCLVIKDALDSLLTQQEYADVLAKNRTASFAVAVPEHLSENSQSVGFLATRQ